jgi:hypothetical protein
MVSIPRLRGRKNTYKLALLIFGDFGEDCVNVITSTLGVLNVLMIAHLVVSHHLHAGDFWSRGCDSGRTLNLLVFVHLYVCQHVEARGHLPAL